MNKTVAILGLAVVIAGGAAAVPAYIGHQTQAAFAGTRSFERADLTIAHQLGEYRKGYLTSTADGTVTITTRAGTISLTAEHQIKHAFVPQVDSTYRLLPGGDELQQTLYAVFGDKPLLLTDSRQTAGGVVVAATMPAVEAVLPDSATRIDFAGMTGQATIRGRQFAGNYAFAPIRIADETGSVEFSAQTIGIELADAYDMLSAGSASYATDRISLSADDESYALHGLQFQQSQTLQDDKVGGDFAMAIASADTPNGSVADLAITGSISNFHRELLDFLVAESVRIAGNPDAAPPSPEVLQPLFARFLEHNPTGSVRFALGTAANERAAVEWKLAYKQRSGMPVDLSNPILLIAGIDTSAVATFKETVLAELAELSEGELGSADEMTAKLAALEAQGYVSRVGDGYRLQVGFADGNFLVNDTPRPELLMMLGALLAQE